MMVYLLLIRRGHMERNSITQEYPIAKAAYAFLQDVSPLFNFPGWNKGRIICPRSQLKRILTGIESSSDGSKKNNIITLSNSPFSPPRTKTYATDVKNNYHDTSASETRNTRTELMTSTA